MSNIVYDAISGFCVGDAVGTWGRRFTQEEMMAAPKKDVIINNIDGCKKGIGSDISSIILSLADSLKSGLDYADIMNKLYSWYSKGKYSISGQKISLLSTTLYNAIFRYEEGVLPLHCGGFSKWDRDNASLVRVLPIAFYLYFTYGNNINNNQCMPIIHNISSLTNGHPVCHIACGIYVCVAVELILGNKDIQDSVFTGIKKAMEYYRTCVEYIQSLNMFSNLIDNSFILETDVDIESGQKANETLEAALCCLLTTDNYRECILKAVNLGGTNVAIAALSGGLAGMYYHYDSIPKEWRDVIARKDIIRRISNKLYYTLIS